VAGAPWSIPTLPDNPDASRSADAAGRPSNAKRLLLAACLLKCHPPAVTNCGRPRKTWRQGAATQRQNSPRSWTRLPAGGQGRRKPPALADEPARLIRKSSMRSRPTNGRRRRRVVSPRASAGRGPSDSRIPETSRVGAAASPMFHRHKTGQPLTARPKACRALPIPALRYCSELDAPCKADNRGGETCAFADAKRVRPPGATQSLFARPRPDRGAGLAGSRARAGEPPGTAETGERPPPRIRRSNAL
jgi:hypothetical protein